MKTIPIGTQSVDRIVESAALFVIRPIHMQTKNAAPVEIWRAFFPEIQSNSFC